MKTIPVSYYAWITKYCIQVGILCDMLAWLCDVTKLSDQAMQLLRALSYH